MALPYAPWKVSEDKELKLRLTSLQATKVEEKIGANLLKVFMPAEGEAFALPPLKVMLLLTHGALQKFEHGISFEDVSDLYDDYVDNAVTRQLSWQTSSCQCFKFRVLCHGRRKARRKLPRNPKPKWK